MRNGVALVLVFLLSAAAFGLDVGVTTVTAPTGSTDSGTVIVPRAICRNFGAVDTIFPVTLTVGSGYSHTVLDTLAAGTQDTVQFGAWLATPVGSLDVACFTSHQNDSNRTNDTFRTSVTVNRLPWHDVGAAAILSPGFLPHAGDSIRPAAVIRNYGNVIERNFDVRFRIGSVYERQVTVTTSLVPDGTVDVTFPLWIARLGTYAVSCSTLLSRDTNPGNDKIETGIIVRTRPVLRVESDLFEQMELGARRSFPFYARLEGGEPETVELRPPRAPLGWQAVLFDSADRDTLPDTDGDGLPDLGLMHPGIRRHFTVRIASPLTLAGSAGRQSGDTVIIFGFAHGDSTMNDSALLVLRLVPAASIHNYPNPFDPALHRRTTFVIGLPAPGEVSLTIYNRAGEQVSRLLDRQNLPSGRTDVEWQGTNDWGRLAAPGVYDYVLDYVTGVGHRRVRKKLVLARE